MSDAAETDRTAAALQAEAAGQGQAGEAQPLEPMRDSFSRRLVLVSRKLRTLFDARTRAVGLTEARARLLLHLSLCEAPTQAELAEAMEVERPTMARLIDAMEQAGLVARQRCPEDRRVRKVVLTEAAQRETRKVLDLSEKLKAEVIAGIPEEDLEVARGVLAKMQANIEKAG